MNHILDNPIYHSLCTGHRTIAKGTDEANYYPHNIAPFAGLKDSSLANLDKLSEASDTDRTFVIFTPKAYEIPSHWKLINQINMFQMVYEHPLAPTGDDVDFEDLGESNVKEMLDLVELTQPGPFRSHTITLGNYTGVFSAKKLVAMAGHRFNPTPYVEISAVCTHPNYLGKGYAYELLCEQIKRILATAQIPFLHVRDDNVAAVKLYQKLGFVIRTHMIAYVVRREV